MHDPADVLGSDDFERLNDSNKVRILISIVKTQAHDIANLKQIVELLKELNKDNLMTLKLINGIKT